MPVSTAPMATPANVRRIGVAPPLPIDPSAYTKTITTTAPANANQMYDQILAIPNTPTASATANAAPALTPRIPGSANGFRVTAWMSAPPIPNATPTIRPRMVRGIRRSRTMMWSPELSYDHSASHTVENGTSLAPMAMLSMQTAARTTTPTIQPSIRLVLVCANP